MNKFKKIIKTSSLCLGAIIAAGMSTVFLSQNPQTNKAEMEQNAIHVYNNYLQKESIYNSEIVYKELPEGLTLVNFHTNLVPGGKLVDKKFLAQLIDLRYFPSDTYFTITEYRIIDNLILFKLVVDKHFSNGTIIDLPKSFGMKFTIPKVDNLPLILSITIPTAVGLVLIITIFSIISSNKSKPNYK
ncbi:MAG: hypothetical protein ACRC42_02180 [Mycoplasma sp.]